MAGMRATSSVNSTPHLSVAMSLAGRDSAMKVVSLMEGSGCPSIVTLPMHQSS